MIRTKADIEFHSDGFGSWNRKPAVNVKVYKSIDSVKLPLDLGRVSKDGGKTFETVKTDPGFTHEWIENQPVEYDGYFWSACDSGWDDLQEVVTEIYGKTLYGNPVKVFSEGRQGGWAVISGINEDVESWNAVDLAKWRKFAKAARTIADNIPRATLELIYFNEYVSTVTEEG